MKPTKLDAMGAHLFLKCIGDFTFAFGEAHRSGIFQPMHIRTAIFGLVSKILIDIPDEKWAQMIAEAKPCGDVGCDCHNALNALMPALDTLRKYGLKVVADKEAQMKGEQSHEM